MLVIRIELWPQGDENRKEIIGTTVIKNNGTGDRNHGSYDYVIRGKKRILKSGCGSIDNFPRQRRSSWHLLYKILRQYVNNRN